MSNEENGTFTRETSTMVAVFESGDIKELRLKGETYKGFGYFVEVPKAKLEDVYLNEIPEDVGIFPVERVVDSGTHTLDFPIPLDTEVIVYNSSVWIELHGYTKYWWGILGLSYYMDLLTESLRRLERQYPEINLEDFSNDRDVHFFLRFSVNVNSDLSINDAIGKVREVFDLLNNSLEEIVSSLRVFVEKRYSDLEQKIQDKWDDSLKAQDSNQKGKSLEELLVLIVSTINGFIPSHRIRTQTEEIDVSVRNESKDPFWSKFTPFILVECKNWSSSCGKDELVLFREKLVNRFGLSHLGFLVSVNGFRETVDKEILRGSKGEYLVVPVDGDNLRELIFSTDRSIILKSFVTKSAFS